MEGTTISVSYFFLAVSDESRYPTNIVPGVFELAWASLEARFQTAAVRREGMCTPSIHPICSLFSVEPLQVWK